MGDKVTENKFHWIFLLGVFLILFLPLLNLPPWFSPPDWGKTIVFRIVLSILLFFFILQKTQINADKTDLCRYGLPFWLLIGLLGIFFLATIFSLDRNFSLWGSPYRSGGFINFAFYIIFAILAFLIVRRNDWQKIWDFAFIVGILVSIIAIFQQFGILSKVFIPFSGRPPSTVGGPIFLAIYLLLLSFLALSFGLKQTGLKKLFYFLSFLLFLSVAIFITQTRAVFVGLAIGFLWFFFAYPKKLILIKIFAGLLLILGVFGLYFLKTHPEVYATQNDIVRSAINRILSIPEGDESRISAWKVSLEALKDRLVLGHGPENFSIGFDRYYDPSLPQIEKMPGVVHSWWDRAHNFVFDIGVTAGIPALIIYLSLFGVLFWQLQRLKYYPNPAPEQSSVQGRSTNDSVIAHGIQATFIGYLVANFFSFDTFSTYLISFLLIGYSLYLISANSNKSTMVKILPWGKNFILVFLFIGLIWFIWIFNLKPFQINTQINRAVYESENNLCQNALDRMEKILPEHSFLDNYLRLQYVTIIQNCAKENIKPVEELAQKATQILKENIKNRPYYTRNWLLLGSYTNVLIEKNTRPELAEGLKQEANFYFEKANQLSPRRQEVFTEWIRTDLLTSNYLKAETKAQTCIDLNEKLEECYWLMGLSQAGLKNIEKSDYYLKIAEEKGFNTQSKNSLYGLIGVYIDTKNYQGLVETYLKLIEIEPQNPQYHASLATAYRELGNYQMAKKEALKVLELKPEAKGEVEEFLKSLSE